MSARRWGLALVAAGLLCALAALALGLPAAAQAAPARQAATPTGDRLAAPPTVENPSQADVGAQVFWLNCQPCHGDVGQGLTDDWRSHYPPEDQNCWKSRCHGDRPYEDGFTLPPTVPAIIGPDTLVRFTSAAELYSFISQAMPFQAPGSLSAADYLALTAFLLRAHDLATPAVPLTGDDPQALLIGLHGTLAPPTATVFVSTATPTPLPVLERPGGQWLGLAAIVAAVALAAGLLVMARRPAPPADEQP